MLFTVTDKKGRFVTDLAKDDFEVIENKRPQPIQEFTAETDLPLRLGILIDTSNSIRDRFRFEQEAAIEFIKSVMRTNEDKAMVVSFDTKAELVSDLIDDTDKLETAIRGLRPGGGTALYDAIYFACRDKLAQDKPSQVPPRHRDGQRRRRQPEPVHARPGARDGAEGRRGDLRHLHQHLPRRADGDKVLKYFAQETGGQAFFPFKVEDLEQSFENIANELRHQYNILYRPEPLQTDGLFHAVELRVKGRKDLIVRARAGYYAPKM